MNVPKLLVAVSLFASILTSSFAQEGAHGTTLRPKQVGARVKGACIAEPGDYTVTVGDLIELDYTWPVVPADIPKHISFERTLMGAVVPSSLGVRHIETPHDLGVDRVAFYFEARRAGRTEVTLCIDGAHYKYGFTVQAVAGKAAEGKAASGG